MRSSGNPLFELIDFFDHHRLMKVMIALAVLFFVLIFCWTSGRAHEEGKDRSEKNRYEYVHVPISQEAFDRDFSCLSITELDQSTQSTNPLCIELEDRDVEITEGGEYYLSGKMTGRIHIDAMEQNVHLFLDGAEILSRSGPALYCENADKLVITLLDGSSNYISDSGDACAEEEAESCIYSVCDLTINGRGELNVSGTYKDAIRSKDVLKILNGTYVIKCKRTAVHGNDGVLVKDGSFMISTEKNAFKTTKKGSDGRGSLIIAGGKMNIIAGRYAFITEKANVYIYGCSITSKSIVDTFRIGGTKNVQWGCIDER